MQRVEAGHPVPVVHGRSAWVVESARPPDRRPPWGALRAAAWGLARGGVEPRLQRRSRGRLCVPGADTSGKQRQQRVARGSVGFRTRLWRAVGTSSVNCGRFLPPGETRSLTRSHSFRFTDELSDTRQLGGGGAAM